MLYVYYSKELKRLRAFTAPNTLTYNMSKLMQGQIAFNGPVVYHVFCVSREGWNAEPINSF